MTWREQAIQDIYENSMEDGWCWHDVTTQSIGKIIDRIVRAFKADGPHDMATGTYVGPEEQFKGRRALLEWHQGGIIRAQFNEGETWETHSWLTFSDTDWDFEVIV